MMMEKTCIFLFSSTAIIAMACFNWMEMWFLMEVNMISFSMYLAKKSKFEISMKYFSIQITSSTLIISSFLMKEKEMFKSKIMFMAIMMKTSIFPFFSWSMKMSEKMSWMKMFFMMSIQKIISIAIMLKFKNNNMEMMLLLNMMIIILSMKNWNSSKKMILMSSTVNFSWILMMNMSMKMSMFFFMLYSWANFCLLKKFESENNKNTNFSKKKMSKTIEIMTISGIPPMMMFFAKWKMTEAFIWNNNIMIALMAFFSSSMMSMFYFKTNMKMLFKEKNKMNSDKKLLFSNMIIIWKMSN